MPAHPHIEQLIDLGVIVLPGEADLSSQPKIAWRRYQTDPPSQTKMRGWLRTTNQAWILCGQVSQLVVIDADDRATADWWLDNWPELAETYQVETPRGRHFYLRTAEPVASWSVHQDDRSFDVRGDGGGVMGPGSTHPNGRTREPASPLQLQSPSVALLRYLQRSGPENSGRPSQGQGKATETSQLATLLQEPPQAGGRNTWLTAVAGHLARRERYQDAFEAQVRSANASLAEPLDDHEVNKILGSIWTSEQAKNPPADAQTGWLQGDGQQLLILQKGRKQDEPDRLVPWSDFDPLVHGVVHDDDGQLESWQLTIRRFDGTTRACTLESNTLAHPQRFNRWCVRNGAICYNTPGAGGSMSSRDRLYKYLVSQGAPELQHADCLGWHNGLGFVTPTHVIRADQVATLAEAGVALRHNDLPYQYGFDGTAGEALAVLREVLTFHEPDACSLFGAWWVAAILKGQILARISQFPMLVLSAPSESGKSTGFFPLMVSLSGAVMRHGAYTPASLRDLMSLNRSGLVWMDDITDLGPQRLEYLRQATVEGEVTKKGGEGFADSVTVRLVSPVMVTGEGFQVVEYERAMADRVLTFQVGSPVGRRSLHGDYPQWDDIVAVQEQYPTGLGCIAGHLVQTALAHGEPLLDQLASLRLGTGRNSDKWAILRLGARVLDSMLDTTEHTSRVDAWCVEQLKAVRQDHYLITRVLPRWLREHWSFLPDEPSPTVAGHLRDGRLYINMPKVADWWQNQTRDERELQLGSEQALRSQAAALGLSYVKTRAGRGTADNRDGRYQMRCLELSEDLTESVLAACDLAPQDAVGAYPLAHPVLPFEQHSDEE